MNHFVKTSSSWYSDNVKTFFFSWQWNVNELVRNELVIQNDSFFDIHRCRLWCNFTIENINSIIGMLEWIRSFDLTDLYFIFTSTNPTKEYFRGAYNYHLLFYYWPKLHFINTYIQFRLPYQTNEYTWPLWTLN